MYTCPSRIPGFCLSPVNDILEVLVSRRKGFKKARTTDQFTGPIPAEKMAFSGERIFGPERGLGGLGAGRQVPRTEKI